jgi:mono/diheme cytochrome c family protein
MRLGFSLFAAAGIALVWAASAAADRFELPEGPDRDLVYGRCRTCHDLQYIVDSAGIGREDWAAEIEDMARYGLRVPPAERDKMAEYLATYLGSDAPKAAPARGPAKTVVDGRTVYQQQCSSCHQPEGGGVARTFPPLAGNPDVFLDRLFPVYVVLNGLEGSATIKGEQYQGVMPPFDHLSDAEIAAVVAYVRGAWGNAALRPAGFADADAAAVGGARTKPMKPGEVHTYRAARR